MTGLDIAAPWLAATPLPGLRDIIIITQIGWSVPPFQRGLDAFPIKGKAAMLSPMALRLKKAIEKKTAKTAPAAQAN